jgi:hypothetical protein
MIDLSRRAIVGAGLFCLGSSGAAMAQTPPDPAALFTDLLSRYVTAHASGINRVAYARWKASETDLAALDAAIDAFARQSPSRLGREAAFAYWANLYNALTLKVVIARFPVASIRDIRSEGVLDPRGLIGPWRTRLVSVEGRRLSLDALENTVLRPLARDPRVHYSINCASMGCPNLPLAAWNAETLDADLDAAARAFINHPRGVNVQADGTLRVSSIYVWFRSDFGGDDAGVLAHLRRHAAPALAQRLTGQTRISGHAYDWAINAA